LALRPPRIQITNSFIHTCNIYPATPTTPQGSLVLGA